jgi:PAS domain S-box-containing protein
VFEWQLRKKHRDGHTLWVREQARAVEDSSGRILVLIVCEDVTGQRQVEEALRRAHDELEQRVSERTEALHRSRERYRRLVESVDVIPWESHAEVGGHTYVGPQAEAALGFPREHWYQDGFWAARVVEEDRQRATEFYDRVARTGKGGDLEYRMIAADGSVVWLRDVVNVATEESGTTVLRGFLIDITKRKEAEALLESQRAFLRQVIDVDPNFIFSKDRDGRFTLVNQAVAEAYGTTVEDLTGKKDEDFNPHPEEVQAFRERDLEVMDSLTEIFVPEEKLTDAEGNTRWLQTVKRPIVDADGVARQVLGSATDITTRKLAEARLRDSANALRIRIGPISL